MKLQILVGFLSFTFKMADPLTDIIAALHKGIGTLESVEKDLKDGTSPNPDVLSTKM